MQVICYKKKRNGKVILASYDITNFWTTLVGYIIKDIPLKNVIDCYRLM